MLLLAVHVHLMLTAPAMQAALPLLGPRWARFGSMHDDVDVDHLIDVDYYDQAAD